MRRTDQSSKTANRRAPSNAAIRRQPHCEHRRLLEPILTSRGGATCPVEEVTARRPAIYASGHRRRQLAFCSVGEPRSKQLRQLFPIKPLLKLCLSPLQSAVVQEFAQKSDCDGARAEIEAAILVVVAGRLVHVELVV